LEWALAACGVAHHLNAKAAPMPVLKVNATPDEVSAHETKLAAWLKTEYTCCQRLARALPDSTLWKILHDKSVMDMWSTITMEFKSKTVLVQ
ncbi:hypothetical protein EDD16DRAFT_1439687, partial [Pisolithus croceorrhizus]